MNILQITIVSEPVQATLTRIEKFATNLAPVAQAALKLEQLIRDTFRDERDPWGNPWPKLSDATIENRKRREVFGKKPLYDSGKMYESIKTSQSATDVYVLADYAPSWPSVHQFGNPENRAWGGPPAPVPARPFFPMHNENSVDVPDAWMMQLYEPMGAALAAAINNSYQSGGGAGI